MGCACGSNDCAPKEAPVESTSSVMAVIGAVRPLVLAALIIAAGVLQYKQIIDVATFNLIVSVLGGGAIASVQTAQTRIEKKTDRALRSL